MNIRTITLPALLLFALPFLVACGGSSESPSTNPSTPPTANAGPDQGSVVPGTFITLNGSGSTSPSGAPLTYAWTLLSKPPNSAAALTNANTSSPNFTVDRSGEYVAQLIVNDGTSSSAPNTVTVSTGNVPPVAHAGLDQGGKVAGTRITLNGGGSSDANGDQLKFSWSLKSIPPGSSAVLADATTVAPSFIADKSGDYTIQLIVNDGTVDSAPDTVLITSQNTAPVAEAGPGQNVISGAIVTLNGSGSSDANGDRLNYKWDLIEKPAGSTATLANATTVSPSFATTANLPGTYTAQLIVNDGIVDSGADTVTIMASNTGPTAHAGDPQNVSVCRDVPLNGSKSKDKNNQPLSPSASYSWEFSTRPLGSTTQLTNGTTVSPSFTADFAGSYVVELKVTEAGVTSQPATVTVTANFTYNAEAELTSLFTPCTGCHKVGNLGTGSHPLSKKGLAVFSVLQTHASDHTTVKDLGLWSNQNSLQDLCTYFQAN
ncbi:MAG: PKD domain-containing protein [Nitrospira sp.]